MGVDGAQDTTRQGAGCKVGVALDSPSLHQGPLSLCPSTCPSSNLPPPSPSYLSALPKHIVVSGLGSGGDVRVFRLEEWEGGLCTAACPWSDTAVASERSRPCWSGLACNKCTHLLSHSICWPNDHCICLYPRTLFLYSHTHQPTHAACLPACSATVSHYCIIISASAAS